METNERDHPPEPEQKDFLFFKATRGALLRGGGGRSLSTTNKLILKGRSEYPSPFPGSAPISLLDGFQAWFEYANPRSWFLILTSVANS